MLLLRCLEESSLCELAAILHGFSRIRGRLKSQEFAANASDLREASGIILA